MVLGGGSDGGGGSGSGGGGGCGGSGGGGTGHEGNVLVCTFSRAQARIDSNSARPSSFTAPFTSIYLARKLEKRGIGWRI